MNLVNIFGLPALVLGRVGRSALLKIVWSCAQPCRAGQQHLYPS